MDKSESGVRITYRVEEVAKMLGVSRSAAYNLVGDGYIRSVRAGRLILIPADALNEFLAEKPR